MRTVSLLGSLLLATITLTLTGCSVTEVMRVQDREIITVKTMIGEMHGTPVLFAGESHDVASHHRLQLDILKALHREGKSLAIGMEMFENTSQKALDAWSAGRVPEYAIRRVYEGNWRNMPWQLYEEILLFARDNRIPIIALNPPREIVQKVSRRGFASLTMEQLGQLPEDVDAKVSFTYLQFMAGAYTMHGRDGDSFRYMCEAQMLRNRVMAWRIANYLEQNPDKVMVVIAGGGHARKMGGIPAELKNLSYKVLLPSVPGLSAESVSADDADYLMEEPFSWLAGLL